ncbi:hypothetical protein BDV28DRAFT_145196 [Aspergillus coremiiformis]|uniref:non-specific serine/threonine protein kinase n=1 Tax=Aspergillus coremiiformis TaxID=138285 RepID=A0A5N6ZHU4_9EURO|nr:hypothetical protein BDV28DRAFT_145196 [Aspergillus coremiiformis]
MPPPCNEPEEKGSESVSGEEALGFYLYLVFGVLLIVGLSHKFLLPELIEAAQVPRRSLFSQTVLRVQKTPVKQYNHFNLRTRKGHKIHALQSFEKSKPSMHILPRMLAVTAQAHSFCHLNILTAKQERINVKQKLVLNRRDQMYMTIVESNVLEREGVVLLQLQLPTLYRANYRLHSETQLLFAVRVCVNDRVSPTSSGSPVRAKSTPPTSGEPSLFRDGVEYYHDDTVVENRVLGSSIPTTGRKLTPIEESPDVSPTVRTVEAVANAKVFFETYFRSIYSNIINPRLQRQQELEHYIHSLPLTLEEKKRVWKNWVVQEQEYLRQCRVLKSRFPGVGHDETVSVAGFEVLKVLGRGSFGVVRLVKEKSANEGYGVSHTARNLPSPEPTNAKATRGGENCRRRAMTGEKKDVFAMKVIRKSAMIRNSQEGHLRAERDFLVASARSRWIVPLIASFQDTNYLYLIMDYMVGGDFLGLLMRRCILPEDIAKWYVAEMILCLEEAHKLCWIHRDVKPDNFLISASGHLKISDFGLAFDGHWAHDQVYYNDHRYSLVRRLGIHVDGDLEDQKEAETQQAEQAPRNNSDNAITFTPPSVNLLEWRDQHQMRRLARSVVGTSQYMAPEVIRGNLYDGRCDWWSVGIILYECLYGFTPFASKDRDRTKWKIHHHLQTLHFPVHRHTDRLVSSEASDLINRLLQEKEYRLSCDTYRQNDLLHSRSAARHLLSSIDPRSRNYRSFYVYPNDAADIKVHPFFRGIKWERLHQCSPPFIPKVKGWEDTRYFEDAEGAVDYDDISMTTDAQDSADEAEGVEGRSNPMQNQAESQQDQCSCKEPTPKEKNPSDASPKGRKRHRDRKRPRDKMLRDKRIQKTVLKMRKEGAFVGYTYRRPKAVAMAFAPERGRLYLARGSLSEIYGS